MKRANRLEFYTTETVDGVKQHRWRVKSGNNRVIAASTEAYSEKRGALRNAAVLFRHEFHVARLIVTDELDRGEFILAVADETRSDTA